MWGRNAKNAFQIGTPQKMKQVIANFLNQDLSGRKPNLCVAAPYCELEEMRAYYGTDNLPSDIEDDYVTLRMHDDLMQGRKDYVLVEPGLGIVGSMPAKEGAEQIASAIENGFNIWSCAGGTSLPQKLQLCEKYFAGKKIAGRQPLFIGFSNGSAMQFYLRGLITPVHYYGVMKALAPTSDAEIKESLLKALEGKSQLYARTLPSDAETVEAIRARYNPSDKISAVTYYPGQLRSACDSLLPHFADDEKLILGVEGYTQSASGFNTHEALFKALSNNVIKPENVLYIVIEDVLQKPEELAIRRINGLIPNLADLNSEELKTITEIASTIGLSPEDYIAKSNRASEAEYARIKDVAKHFGIPVVDGGERRAGHSNNAIVQPKKITALEFIGDKIIQTSTIAHEPMEYLPSLTKSAETSTRPDWEELTPIIEEYQFYPDTHQYNKGAPASAVDAQSEIDKIKLH